MLNLKYRATATFTSADIKDLAENEPIFYEVWANRPDGWTAKCKAFFESNGDDTELGLDVVGLSLVSVAQDGEKWPCVGRDGAQALRESIEAQNPGYGDYFIRNLTVAIFDQQISREDSRLGNSSEPLTPSVNGSKKKKSRSVATKA